eukprot:TRINITY_DN8986_c0_g1_i1.p1 TRINITY_DN8986_c0_g1~~TRINITY_DN8986_c0_g1_i1.p1  ORF type:complete len:311 (+),score=27.30 TRINITY_DN8986_c0_g1_i1:45-977(+)
MDRYFIDGLGDLIGRTIEILPDARTVLGRKPGDNGQKIDNEKVSSKHCSIYIQNGVMLIEDTSKNGTFVNGVCLQNSEKKLHNGDVVSLLSTKKWPDHKNVQFSVRCPGNQKLSLSEDGDQPIKKQKTEDEDASPPSPAAATAVCGYCAKGSNLASPQCGICQKICCSDSPGSCVDSNGRTIVLQLPHNHQFASLPDELFGGNTIELEIFTSYLRDNHVDASTVWSTHALSSGISTVPICTICATKEFVKALYALRVSVHSQLSAAVTSREDCWYGSECRTQHHNRAHAMRLNHICDYTGSPSKNSSPKK